MTSTIPDFRLNKLGYEDVLDSYLLHTRCEDDALDWDQFSMLIGSSDVAGCVAKVDDEVVGYLLYRFDIECDTVEIMWCGVDVCFRECGIASSMIEWLKLRVIFHSTYKRIDFAIEEGNDPAYQLLTHHKFQCVRVMRVKSCVNWLVMRFNRTPKQKLSYRKQQRFEITMV